MLRATLLCFSVFLLCTCDPGSTELAERAQNGNGAEESHANSSPPNIILILTDDQGYGDLGAHGNPWLKTPNLDQLHDESLRFTNFHVATTCAPTRAGLLSGINCNRAGAWHTINGRSFLAARYRTLPNELREEGYQTAMFGKWHLGDNYPFRPQDRGFEETIIHGGGGVGQTPDYWNNDYFDDTYLHNGQPEQYAGYCTDVWFEESIRWMEKAAATGKPFFSYIATNAPHSPFHVEEEYTAPYRSNQDIVSPEFYGMIANIDENVGRLRQWLRETGLDSNTVLIYTTDNGTSGGAQIDNEKHVTKGFNAGMRGKKVDEYEGGHRVPLFINLPETFGIKPAAKDLLINYTDLLPTLVELVGGSLDFDYQLDGKSFFSVITGKDDAGFRNRSVVVDTQRKDLPVKGKRSCVMQDNWRLINDRELYNLAADPGQRINLIAKHPDVAEELRADYEAWWTSMEEDLKRTNRVVIGHPAENPTLLTSHDWHIDVDPPWHQRHIRAAPQRSGYWALRVAETGTYRVRLYRYPPSTGFVLNAAAAPLPPVPGGTGLVAGKSLDVRQVQVITNGEEVVQKVDPNEQFAELTMELEQGELKMEAILRLADGTSLGAYYMELELMK